MQIEQWLWQLRGEVKRIQELGFLLKNIGCYRPRKLLPSVFRPGSSAAPANPDGASVPLSSSTGDQLQKTMTAVVGSSLETTAGSTSDLTGTQQNETTATNTDKNVTFGVSPGDNGRGGCEHEASIDFRQVENQVREGFESLEFHLTVLQRSVDQAHINMRIASQEFSSLLKKVRGMSDGFDTCILVAD